jgi:hypothetical protein
LNVEKSVTSTSTSTSKQEQEQEQSNINNITETIQVQKEPALLENITSNTPSSIEKVNNDKSENMKTIVIKDQ